MLHLFSIPIYSCNKKEFAERYQKFLESKMKLKIQASEFSGVLSKEEIINEARKVYWKEGIWEFNQIIGYIKIYFHELSFWFEIFSSDENKRYIFGTKRKYVSRHILNGVHFTYEKDNNLIRKNMVLFLDLAIETLPKGCFADLESFNLINRATNYINIIAGSNETDK